MHIFSRLLYAAETWTLKVVDGKQLLAIELPKNREIVVAVMEGQNN